MTRALLVIDVQNEYETGGLPIAHPPVREALGNVVAAVEAARGAGAAVVWVRQNAPEGSPIFATGSAGWEWHPSVAPLVGPEDHVVDKLLPSAFAGTDLDGWLREHDVDTLTVVGFMTQNCVESTVRDAVHRGWAVEVLSDATGAVGLANAAGSLSARQVHEAVLVVLQSRFAAVAPTAEWAAALASGGQLERSSLLASATAAR